MRTGHRLSPTRRAPLPPGPPKTAAERASCRHAFRVRCPDCDETFDVDVLLGRPNWGEPKCSTSRFSSRCCELGTRGCDVVHRPVSVEDEAMQISKRWTQGTGPPELAAEIVDLVARERALMGETAAQHIEVHCCVSTCCDAQPGGTTAKELADCLRASIVAAAQRRDTRMRP